MAVLGVFALLGVTLWWLRRRGAVQVAPFFPLRSARKANSEKLLHRIETLPLSATHSLNLVRLADRAILIGTSPAGFYLVESSSWKSLEGKTEEAGC
jgi:flagellar biogenesis protein FliO